jgi:hypothetical protein
VGPHGPTSADRIGGQHRHVKEKIMKARNSAAALGAAALLSTGGFLLPAAASPHATTHTLKFTAITLKTAVFSKTSGGEVDKSVNSKGKIIGFDEISFGKSQRTGGLVIDTDGSFIYATLTFTPTPVTNGTITGGTGKFKGVTGTVVGTNLNHAGTKTAVVVTYH